MAAPPRRKRRPRKTEENMFLIFGGPTVDMSTRQRKRERHEVLAAEKAPPSFLS
jgi:hypothetical protein